MPEKCRIFKLAVLVHVYATANSTEAEAIYEAPEQTRRNELLEKARELNERALRCPGTPAAMITLLRELTDLTVKLAEKS